MPDGIVLVAIIIFWNYAFDWLRFRFTWFASLIEAPLPLIKNSNLLRRNMRQELITEHDLRMQLREQGLYDLTKVKEAYIESKPRRHQKVKRKEQ
jgi:uncharacterized membrane protein YcaP (DUF421 family)